MGTAKPPEAVKLFVGLISSQPSLFEEAAKALSGFFGPIETKSPLYPWNHTDYYREELGRDLMRQFLFFQEPITPERLSEIKEKTNAMEQCWVRRMGTDLKRQINLDPGYIAPSKVVLATTKDFAHRIYLSRGIYAEVTLIYRGNSFQPLPYTYPDFRTEEYIKLFNMVRASWMHSPAFAHSPRR
jgi:hypothetical protein